MHEVCADDNLHPDETFLLKIAQLDELLVIRHCIFIVGTSGNGMQVPIEYRN